MGSSSPKRRLHVLTGWLTLRTALVLICCLATFYTLHQLSACGGRISELVRICVYARVYASALSRPLA
jgi:hypothetical protein